MENLTAENIELRTQNTNLNNKIYNIEYKIDMAEQRKLDHNIIINGINESEHEDKYELVTKISHNFDVQMEATDIEYVSRIATMNENSGFPKSLIVMFKNKNIRDNLLKNRKKEVFTNPLQQTGINRRIYISEQLTARKQYLFKFARDIKRNNFIKYVWVKDGELFIRKDDHSKILKIKNLEQLKQYDIPNE